jgi:phytoene/squalene synthetase
MLPRISTDRKKDNNQNPQPQEDVREELQAEEKQKFVQSAGNEGMEGLFDIVTKSKDIGNEAMGDILTGEKGMSEKEPYELDFFGNKKEPDDYNSLDRSVI